AVGAGKGGVKHWLKRASAAAACAGSVLRERLCYNCAQSNYPSTGRVSGLRSCAMRLKELHQGEIPPLQGPSILVLEVHRSAHGSHTHCLLVVCGPVRRGPASIVGAKHFPLRIMRQNPSATE